MKQEQQHTPKGGEAKVAEANGFDGPPAQNVAEPREPTRHQTRKLGLVVEEVEVRNRTLRDFHSEESEVAGVG